MQPYQEASREIQRQGEAPITALKTAGAVAGSGLALKRVLPFLSKYIPQDFAIKGLSKVDPRFGTFINKALNEGADIDEVKDFIKSKVAPQEEEEEPEAAQGQNPKDARNIIEQYDPELHTYLRQKIKAGESPIKAGTQALTHGRFKRAIDKLTKDHKAQWADILQSVYGAGQGNPQQAQPPQQTAPQQQAQPGPQQNQGALLQAIQQAAAVRQRKAQP